ncbi:methylenetetrahydrofolate reductase [Buchnera aphidicola]|uniref:methylenetetrahydrofolate reductase n=1 Tax=Buchnera aphidicola TaxID=9 RepID=UPI003463B673
MDFPYNNSYYRILDEGIFNIISKVHISFEFFPPKIQSIENSKFLSSINRLSVFRPDFISITCTSNSNLNDLTYRTVHKLQNMLNINISPHITYINSTDHEIKRLAKNYWDIGIRNIVALRGDFSEQGSNRIVYASDLVSLLKEVADFEIAVAAYPEVHPESNNSQLDLINLKRKIDAGANKAITQFFFNINNYLRFRDRCASIGIYANIIPGILPILDFKQLKRFASMTNVCIPKWIRNFFDNLDPNDVYTTQMIGLAISVNMINQLYIAGVRHFHFYTLNKSDIIYSLCHMLNSSRK